MEATLNQPCRVQDEGPMGRKLLLYQRKPEYVYSVDSMVRISIG